ncbi:hypothetical protein EZS27_043463, partial [termite gut metagenome]
NKEELVYKILDEQAIVGAVKKTTADKMKEGRKEEKRKRPHVTTKDGNKVVSASANRNMTKTNTKPYAEETQNI